MPNLDRHLSDMRRNQSSNVASSAAATARAPFIRRGNVLNRVFDDSPNGEPNRGGSACGASKRPLSPLSSSMCWSRPGDVNRLDRLRSGLPTALRLYPRLRAAGGGGAVKTSCSDLLLFRGVSSTPNRRLSDRAVGIRASLSKGDWRPAPLPARVGFRER